MIVSKRITQKTIHGIMLLCIFFLAVFLRVYRLENRMWWGGDMGRDFLVASHIVKYGEFPLLGHAVASLQRPFYAPPYYYYFLSLFTRISFNPVIVFSIIAVLQACVIYAVYGIGKILHSARTGLWAALAYAVSAELVEVGTNVWSAHIVFPFILFGIWLVLQGRENKNIYDVLTGYMLLLFGITIHLSAAVFMMFLFIQDLLIIQNIRRSLVYVCGLLVALFVLYSPLFASFGFSTTISAYSPQKNIVLSINEFFKLFETVKTLWLMMFSFNGWYALSGAVLIGSMIPLFIKKGIKKFNTRATHASLILGWYICVLSMLPKSEAPLHLYSPIIPFVCIWFVSIIEKVFMSGSIKNKFFGFLCFLFLIYGITGGKDVLIWRYTHENSQWLDTQATAQYIVEYAQSRRETSGLNFYISAGAPNSGYEWEKYGIWYAIEYAHGIFTKSVFVNGNMVQLATNSSTFFHVCERYSQDKIQEGCVNQFVSEHPTYILVNKLNNPVSDYVVYEYSAEKHVTQ